MRFIKLSLSICTLVGIVTFQARGEDEPKAPATKSFTHLVSHQGHTADTAAVRLGRPTCRPGRGVHEEVEGTGAPCRMFTAEGQGHGFFNRPPWLEKTTLRMDEFLVSIGYIKPKAGSAAVGNER